MFKLKFKRNGLDILEPDSDCSTGQRKATIHASCHRNRPGRQKRLRTRNFQAHLLERDWRPELRWDLWISSSPTRDFRLSSWDRSPPNSGSRLIQSLGIGHALDLDLDLGKVNHEKLLPGERWYWVHRLAFTKKQISKLKNKTLNWMKFVNLKLAI